MALRAGKLWVVRPAPLTVPEPMPATMTAALLRAVAKTAERRAVETGRAPAERMLGQCAREARGTVPTDASIER